MGTRGLSLVGFYDQERDALAHLRNTCVFRDASDASLRTEWVAARSKLGPPVPRAGAPEVREFEFAEAAYVRELRAQPWVNALLRKPTYQSAEFKLVEIEPLLAHQPFIDLERVQDGSRRLSGSTVAELMPICLPQAAPQPLEPPTVVAKQPHSIVIKSRRAHIDALVPGVMTIDQDGFEHTLAGVNLHLALPFINVVRLGGRYLLRSGYHRVFGAAKLGATHIPCLVREVTYSNSNDGSLHPSEWLMMPRWLLESENPPTLAHFLKGRAHDVMLRATSLVLQITWGYHRIPDEYEGL